VVGEVHVICVAMLSHATGRADLMDSSQRNIQGERKREVIFLRTLPSWICCRYFKVLLNNRG
jgi:hypothetical protein